MRISSYRGWSAMLIALFCISCSRGEPAEKDAMGWPSATEVLSYLDGKTISAPGQALSEGAARSPKSFVLRREDISALEIKKSGVAADGGPWSTTIHFIFREDGRRYAVDAVIDHRKVDNQRAFFGLKVDRIAEQ